eukprot:m.56 g.56  ORF g.56 m.56 type:complete len:286 (+) comp25_c0_seq1:200-1057(+)
MGVEPSEECRFGSYPGTSFSLDKEKTTWSGSFWGYGDQVESSSLSCLNMVGSAELLAPTILASLANITAQHSQPNNMEPAIMVARLEVVSSVSPTQLLYWNIRRSMRFLPLLERIADDVMLDKVGGKSYLAVHLRRADFLVARRDKVPPLSVTTAQIAELLDMYGLSDVFVASDARPDDEEFNTFLMQGGERSKWNGQEVHFHRLEGHEVGGLKSGQIAVVDQIICTHARVFLGTPSSTFTSRIQEERDLHTHHDEVTSHLLLQQQPPPNSSFDTNTRAIWQVKE